MVGKVKGQGHLALLLLETLLFWLVGPDESATPAGLVLFFGMRGAQSLGRILVVIYMRRPHPSVVQV